MVSNIDRVYATEYSRKKRRKKNSHIAESIDYLPFSLRSRREWEEKSRLFRRIRLQPAVKLLPISNDTRDATDPGARLTIRRELETASTISFGRRWPPQLRSSRANEDYVDYSLTITNGIESFPSVYFRD